MEQNNSPAPPADNQDGNSFIYIITYLIPLLTGILVYFTYAKGNKRVTFHANQAIMISILMIGASLVFSVIFTALAIFSQGIGSLGGLSLLYMTLLINLIIIAIWLYGIYVGTIAAFRGKDIKMPIVGDIASRPSKV